MRKAVSTLALLALAGLVVSCASAPVTPAEQAATTGPEWEIELAGARVDTMTSASLNQLKSDEKAGYGPVSFERKGESTDYLALPLSYLVGIVDGGDAGWPFSFNVEAWNEGYDVTLTAADGYAVTFSTAEVAADALYLADVTADQATLPRIVGDVPGNLQIRDLVAIELSLGDAAATEEFTLELEINGEVSAFTREELEMMPFYTEAVGSYTTSAGTTHTHRYGGVKFAELLKSYVPLSEENTVTVAAMDGYEMSYSGAELMDESDGSWILAFKSDGEYLPLDPGYVRSVKVGPSEPNIDGHSSARMIKRVIVSAESYRDFELVITGKMDNRLDRQTVQAGVSCHGRNIAYYNRKSEGVENYTGIPLWLLLAYGDDSLHAPHRQTDKEILSYKEDVAETGYTVEIVAADGYSIRLDSTELNKNDDVVIATMKEGDSLPEREWPMILVWDQDAELVPAGIKAVRNITQINLIFD